MEWVAGKEFTEFIESQSNKMKRNIKMRVTPEQLEKICNIISKAWLYFKAANYMYIFNDGLIEVSYSKENWSKYNLQEIDADLFIRTNGTCGETFKEQQSYNDGDLIIKDDNIYMIGNTINKHNDITILEQKLQKKNEILKKARIKRKNQREELNKLNLKLQKCISLEEHRKVINWHIERNQSLFAEIDKLKAENKSLKESSKISCNMLHSQKDTIVSLRDDVINKVDNMRDIKNKEIEKLKAVIEYLESKVK